MAIDGNSLRGTATSEGKPIVHMVSAWARANNLVLAQRKTDAKSNEITAIPQLLAALELSGTVVAIDAISCQKAIAQQDRPSPPLGAVDYLLRLLCAAN